MEEAVESAAPEAEAPSEADVPDPAPAATPVKGAEAGRQEAHRGSYRSTAAGAEIAGALEVEKAPKKRVALVFGYNGKRFAGLQINPGQRTVEAELELAMFRAGAVRNENFGNLQKLSYSRACRTDKGVHAATNVASARLILDKAPGDAADDSEEDALRKRINAELPEDIRIFGVNRATKSFHSKMHCSKRRYVYILPTFLLQPVEAMREVWREAFVSQGLVSFGERGFRLPKPVAKRPAAVQAEAARARAAEAKPAEGRGDAESGHAASVAAEAGDVQQANEGDAAEAAPLEAPAAAAASPPEPAANASTPGTDVPTAPAAPASDAASALAAAPEVSEEKMDVDEITVEGAKTAGEDGSGAAKAAATGKVADADEAPNELSDPTRKAFEVASPEVKAAAAATFRGYRLPSESLARLREAVQVFCGTHRFHNYTLPKGVKSYAACMRYIMSMEVSDPFVPEAGGGLEWVRVTLQGQSFLLNQIRKMVAMLVEVTRGQTSLDALRRSLEEVQMELDMAPPTGLYLERPYFDHYNSKLASDRPPLAWHTALDGELKEGKHSAELAKIGAAVDAFRTSNIERFIVEEETQDEIFVAWAAWLTYKRRKYKEKDLSGWMKRMGRNAEFDEQLASDDEGGAKDAADTGSRGFKRKYGGGDDSDERGRGGSRKGLRGRGRGRGRGGSRGGYRGRGGGGRGGRGSKRGRR